MFFCIVPIYFSFLFINNLILNTTLVYIYYSYLSEENHENLMQNELPKFPFDFVKKIKKNKRWKDAQLSLLGRILLFRGIREQYNIDLEEKDIRYNVYNKPFFKDNPVYFSISHSGEIVLCAISDNTPIGIDIEKMYEIKIDTFRPYMLDSEWNRIILSSDKHGAFFDYWTQKEAVIKNFGSGEIDLKSFKIVDSSTMIGNEKFYLKEIKIDPKYKCNISHKNRFLDFYRFCRI